MKHILYILIIFLGAAFGLHAQNTMSSPVDVGTKRFSFTYSSTLNTAGYTNSYGRSTNDVFYRFTLSVPMEIEISHCGSAVSDTYIYLLDTSGSLIVSIDDYSGTGQCPNTYHPYHKRQLAAGTYYVVSEGYSANGNITTSITGTAATASIVDIGTKSASFTRIDAQNTANTGNNYTGRAPNDVLYRFTLTVPMEITASHCGSELSDTYMTLLDASGNIITYNDDYSGEGKCSNTYHSVIKRQLEAGSYCIVSEGYSQNGVITTTITGMSANVPVTSVSLDQTVLSTAVGLTSQLTATVTPAAAANKTVTWNSSNPAVATVSAAGLVTALSVGTAVITVTTTDGNRTASCNVTVFAIEPYVKAAPVEAVPSVDRNYIKSRTYTSENGAYYMDAVQYFDGLGRPSQTVQVGITPGRHDLVALQEYDSIGRESRVWLPAVVDGNNGNRGAFVTGNLQSMSRSSNGDQNPFAYPVYEPSPLNRVLQQYGPGENWHIDGKSVKTDYLTNSSIYPCVRYYMAGDNIERNSNYDDGQLYVAKITDEEGSISYEFKDKQGRVILQRQMDGQDPHDTYYVYNDFNNLRYVLPPMVAVGNYNENDATIKNYAYVYKYDYRKRCIYKKLPGCEAVCYVYDRADRLIFFQDGEQQPRNEWLFNKYDAFGRVILTGIYSDSRTQAQLAEAFKNTLVVESFPGGNYGYTWNVQPIVDPEKVLTVNHYDDYQHLLDQSPDFNRDLNYEPNPGYGTRHGSGKGLPVGTRVKLMDGSGEIVTTMYYDERGRIVQKKSTNHLGGLEKEYYAYSFSGQVEKKLHEHSAPGKPTRTEIYGYDYDHAERLVRTKYTLNNTEILMNKNEYDELGRLKTTTPHRLDNFKSTYDYTVRSWISRIAGTNYTEDLTYMYNGNVKTMQWMQGGATRKYTFAYDGLSRLETAIYNNSTSEQFSTSYIYDKHGNITRLIRSGLKSRGIYDYIDRLTLNYGGSNQLKYVNDAEPNVALSISYDFKDYKKGTDQEYWYNANGAMTKDLNKGVLDVTYNVLNLPSKVDILSPVAEARNEYIYSAGGQKLKVVSKWNSGYSNNPVVGTNTSLDASRLNTQKTTDYAGNIIYENDVLKRILTDNGYYENGNYYFYVKNHLGSNVMTVKQDGSIVQNNHYYPFGLTMSASTNQGGQPYKYTGKELDMEHGLMQYDYEARQYDPAVGRFMSMDPLCEKYYSISPYAYCANNPVKNIDPDGRWVWAVVGAAVDYGFQVYDNYKEGKTGYDAWVGDVNFVSVGLSAINPTGKLKVLKTVAVEVVKAATENTTVNDGLQINTDVKEVATKAGVNTVVDVGVGKVTKAGSDDAVKAANRESATASKQLKTAEKQAQRSPNSTKKAEAVNTAQSNVQAARNKEVTTKMLNSTVGQAPNATQQAAKTTTDRLLKDGKKR